MDKCANEILTNRQEWTQTATPRWTLTDKCKQRLLQTETKEKIRFKLEERQGRIDDSPDKKLGKHVL